MEVSEENGGALPGMERPGGPNDGLVIAIRAAEHAAPARHLDPSAGTPIDPLKNKTYDLNYAKTVPQLQ